MSEAFQYAVLRVVPSVERGECFNAGVVVYCPAQRWLRARTALDGERLAVLGPALDPAAVQAQLRAIEHVAAGEASGGPVAAMAPSARFHWLVAPASTVVQPSAVHTGLTDDPSTTLDRLFSELVERP